MVCLRDFSRFRYWGVMSKLVEHFKKGRGSLVIIDLAGVAFENEITVKSGPSQYRDQLLDFGVSTSERSAGAGEGAVINIQLADEFFQAAEGQRLQEWFFFYAGKVGGIEGQSKALFEDRARFRRQLVDIL